MATTKHIENLPFTTKSVIGAQARIGLVVLASDYTIENEFKQVVMQQGVDIYHSRIANAPDITPETLRAMGPTITETASRLLPNDELDVLAYGCTAASVVLGNDKVAEYMNSAKPGTPCVTPSSAAFDAFKALGVKKVSVLTPYTQDVTDSLVSCFSQHSPEVLNAVCFGLADDRDMARISRECIIEGGVAACDPDAEALFISCTAVRAAVCVGGVWGQQN